jgi:hypothetical protein
MISIQQLMYSCTARWDGPIVCVVISYLTVPTSNPYDGFPVTNLENVLQYLSFVTIIEKIPIEI